MIYRLKIIQNFVHSASARSLPRQSRVNNPPNHTFWRVGTGKVRSNHTFRPARSHFRGVESHKKSRLSRGREAHFAWRPPALSCGLLAHFATLPAGGDFSRGGLLRHHRHSRAARPKRSPSLLARERLWAEIRDLSPFYHRRRRRSCSVSPSCQIDRGAISDSSSSLCHEPKTRHLCKIVQKAVEDAVQAAASRHLAAAPAVPPLAVLLLLRPCRPGRCSPRTPHPPYDTCAPRPGAVDEPPRRPPEPQPTPVLTKEEPQPTPVTVPEELVLGWDALRAGLCESPHGTEARNRLVRLVEDSGDLEKMKGAHESLLKMYPNTVRNLRSVVNYVLI